MTSLKQFELQQQIKENSQGMVNTITELHKWEKDIKSRTSPANSQTKKYEVSFLDPLLFITIRKFNIFTLNFPYLMVRT